MPRKTIETRIGSSTHLLGKTGYDHIYLGLLEQILILRINTFIIRIVIVIAVAIVDRSHIFIARTVRRIIKNFSIIFIPFVGIKIVYIAIEKVGAMTTMPLVTKLGTHICLD